MRDIEIKNGFIILYGTTFETFDDYIWFSKDCTDANYDTIIAHSFPHPGCYWMVLE